MTHLRQSYVTGHTKKLRSLVFNPTTPNLLATCALDGFVKIWNLASSHSYASCSPAPDRFHARARARAHAHGLIVCRVPHSRSLQEVASVNTTSASKIYPIDMVRLTPRFSHTDCWEVGAGF
jgi:WD40 repeat protein